MSDDRRVEKSRVEAPPSRSADSIVAVGRDGPRTWADLVQAAHGLWTELDALGWQRPVIACSDRYLLAASLLACWAGGGTAILPPDLESETILRLSRGAMADGVMHDGALGSDVGLDVTAAVAEEGNSPGLSASRQFAGVLMRGGRDHLVTLYSSGFTGEPVASRKSARQLLGEARLVAATFGFSPEDRVLATAPSHHIYGLLFGVLAPLLAGASFVRSSSTVAEAIRDLTISRGATVLCAMPAHLEGLRALGEGLGGIQRIFSSGAPLPVATAEMLRVRFGVTATDVLGSTETGGIAWRRADGRSAWTPFSGVRVEADADGTILVDSPFVDSPFERAGGQVLRGAERVEMLADGTFRHLGRADVVVKIGADRVSLREIEQRLLAFEGVKDAAIQVLERSGLRQQEIIAVVVAPGLSESALRRELSRWLPAAVMPRRLLLVDRLLREEGGQLGEATLLGLVDEPSPGSQP